MEGIVSNIDYEDCQEGWITPKSIEFMENANNQSKQFFIHVSFLRAHQCTSPSEQFWSMYDNADIQLPPNFSYDMKNKAHHLISEAKSLKKGD